MIRTIRTGAAAGALLGSLLFALPAGAQWFDTPIPVPPTGGVAYGWGYDSQTRQIKAMKKCVELNNAPQFELGSGGKPQAYSLITSFSETVEQSSFSAGLSMAAGAFGGSVSGTNINGSSVNFFNLQIHATSATKEKPLFLDPDPVRLKADYARMLANPTRQGAFRNECGDSFVIGIVQGKMFEGLVTVDTSDFKEWSKFSIGGGASYSGAGGNLGYGESLEMHFGSDSLKISVYTSDTGGQNVTSIKGFNQLYRQYNMGSGGRNQIDFFVAPYSILENYPLNQDIFSLEIEPTGMAAWAMLLWDYKAVIADADFILAHPDQFALGIHPETRKKRLAAVKNLRNRWVNEFKQIQREAQSCLGKFTEACDTAWKKYRDPLPDRALLPDRYKSRCADIEIDPNRNMGITTILVHTIKAGDQEMGGGPVKATATARPYIDGSKLMMELTIDLQEWKTDSKGRRTQSEKEHTWFQGGTQVPLFDLSGPNASGTTFNFPGALQECMYSRGGLYPDRQTGRIEGMSGRHPRGYQRFANGTGLLSEMSCVVDKRGKETQTLECNNIKFRTAKIRLVNEKDWLIDGIFDDIRDLEQEIRTLRARVAELEKKKSRFSFMAGIYQHMIQGLQTRIREKEEKLAALRQQAPAPPSGAPPRMNTKLAAYLKRSVTKDLPLETQTRSRIEREVQGRFAKIEEKRKSQKIQLPAGVAEKMNRRLIRLKSPNLIRPPQVPGTGPGKPSGTSPGIRPMWK
ncbi:MAG: hypothetical protein Kow00128_18140 [Deltaproteobacteria bacterium]